MRRHVKASSAGSTFGNGRRLGLLALGIAALLAFAATPAVAAFTEKGSFAGGGPGEGGSGSADGELSNPGQADVNDATGKLYVADTGNNRVQAFTTTETSGAYDSQVAITAPTGLAIDQDTGTVYVANASGISKFDSSLSPAAGWTDPGVSGTLAVDPSTGDLLVADQGANLIRRFQSDGTAAGSFAAERPLDLAVNSSGQIFVVTSTGDIFAVECSATSAVQRFSGAGVAEGTVEATLFEEKSPGAVAVDPDDDSLVVAAPVDQYNCGGEHPRVFFLDASGSLLESVQLAPNTLFATVPGLAARGGGFPRVYAITKSPLNDEYGATQAIVLAELFPPEATIDPVDPGSVTTSEASFSGTVDPEREKHGLALRVLLGRSAAGPRLPARTPALEPPRSRPGASRSAACSRTPSTASGWSPRAPTAPTSRRCRRSRPRKGRRPLSPSRR